MRRRSQVRQLVWLLLRRQRHLARTILERQLGLLLVPQWWLQEAQQRTLLRQVRLLL